MNTIPPLSEAIRLGAMLRPQVRFIMFDRGGSCGLGAAMETTGCENSVQGVHQLMDHYPMLISLLACPVCEQTHDLFEIIGEHLNDRHLWTRERIADQVEVWERELEPQSAGCAEEVRHEQLA